MPSAAGASWAGLACCTRRVQLKHPTGTAGQRRGATADAGKTARLPTFSGPPPSTLGPSLMPHAWPSAAPTAASPAAAHCGPSCITSSQQVGGAAMLKTPCHYTALLRACRHTALQNRRRRRSLRCRGPSVQHLTEGGSLTCAKNKSRWCAPSGMRIAFTESLTSCSQMHASLTVHSPTLLPHGARIGPASMCCLTVL